MTPPHFTPLALHYWLLLLLYLLKSAPQKVNPMLLILVMRSLVPRKPQGMFRFQWKEQRALPDHQCWCRGCGPGHISFQWSGWPMHPETKQTPQDSSVWRLVIQPSGADPLTELALALRHWDILSVVSWFTICVHFYSLCRVRAKHIRLETLVCHQPALFL